ncbi:MAG: winged helix-turn-helix domain-containing protein [Candidatus Lokiarchaeota archaeon]|nr:winged helix-turn-helix domain-containing protein [Candidatus Lokiarchaeota archaeon]
MKISVNQRRLLNILYTNSRITNIELGEILQKSRQTVWQYLKKLNLNGAGFEKIQIHNPNREDNRIFFVEIKTNPEEPEIITKLSSIFATKSIDGIIGTTSLMVKFQVRTSEEFRAVLRKIDSIIAKSRFQFYHVIDILNVFKEAGHVFSENLEETFHTIRLSNKLISQTDFPYKWYIQLIPKILTEYNEIAENFLAPKDQIIDLYRTGQEFGLLAVVRTQSKEKYSAMIQDLYSTGKFQDSHTIFVLDERLPSTFKPFRI